MTSTPISVAYSTLEIASAVVPEPPASRNLAAMILTFQLTPVTPTPLLPTPPIVPEQCEPWPLSSMGSLSLLTKSQPWTSSMKPLPSSSMPLPAISPGLVQALAARSGWL